MEAVSGNVDDPHDPMLPRERTMPVGALTLHVSHGDELGSPTPELLLARYGGDVIVFGHTHTPLVFATDDAAWSSTLAPPDRGVSIWSRAWRFTVDGRNASVEFFNL